MSAVEKMTELVREAEGLRDPRPQVKVIIAVLAEAVVAGEGVDQTKLGQLGVRLASGALAGTTYQAVAADQLLEAIRDHRDHGRVKVADGRVATPGGWNYENAQPVQVYLPAELYWRMRNWAATRLGDGTFDGVRETLVATAVREYLERQGA